MAHCTAHQAPLLAGAPVPVADWQYSTTTTWAKVIIGPRAESGLQILGSKSPQPEGQCQTLANNGSTEQILGLWELFSLKSSRVLGAKLYPGPSAGLLVQALALMKLDAACPSSPAKAVPDASIFTLPPSPVREFVCLS